MQFLTNKNLKTYIFSLLLWIINLKVFLIISNWTEISEIFKYSSGLINFFKLTLDFYLDFVQTIPIFTLFLSFLFALLLLVFWFYYFKVYFYKFPNKETPNTSLWGMFATFLTYLGFGCVACGQTLLTSLLFFFVSNSSVFFAHFIGNFSIVLGLFILSFGIYKNFKIYKNKNLCDI